MKKYDVIVVGAGFAGATIAERFASEGKNVLVIEKRDHVGGNAYDYIDGNNVLRHAYGPHIFHTNIKEVYDYLSNFTEWFKYEHRVLGYIEDKLVPIPFNLTSIEKCFDEEKSQKLKNALIEKYGMEMKVPILELLKNEDLEIQELANYIYEHVFKHYTMKQWGLKPDEIDAGVTSRVPVFISYDDRYFQDTYQYMPKNGYTAIFDAMLKNVDVLLNTNVNSLVTLKDGQTYYQGEKFDGIFVYTGAVDDLLDDKYGVLPYRSLDFVYETHEGDYQSQTTINYPTPANIHPYTRITEYKKMMYEIPSEKTTVMKEYSKDYNKENNDIPYYPIFTKENEEKYELYVQEIKKYKNIFLLGRLAEYKYYNMDLIIKKALNLYREIKK